MQQDDLVLLLQSLEMKIKDDYPCLPYVREKDDNIRHQWVFAHIIYGRSDGRS